MNAKDRIAEFDRQFTDSSICSELFKRYLIDNGFFMKPAAISHHGNYTYTQIYCVELSGQQMLEKHCKSCPLNRM